MILPNVRTEPLGGIQHHLIQCNAIFLGYRIKCIFRLKEAELNKIEFPTMSLIVIFVVGFLVDIGDFIYPLPPHLSVIPQINNLPQVPLISVNGHKDNKQNNALV